MVPHGSGGGPELSGPVQVGGEISGLGKRAPNQEAGFQASSQLSNLGWSQTWLQGRANFDCIREDSENKKNQAGGFVRDAQDESFGMFWS